MRVLEALSPPPRRLYFITDLPDLGDSARTTATVTPASNSTDSTYLDPLAPMFTPRFVSTPPSTAIHLFVSVLLPVDSTFTTDPRPYAVDEGALRIGEFSCGRPPKFALDEETQLKVHTSSPNLKKLELPEHVNVLFLQTAPARC